MAADRDGPCLIVFAQGEGRPDRGRRRPVLPDPDGNRCRPARVAPPADGLTAVPEARQQPERREMVRLRRLATLQRDGLLQPEATVRRQPGRALSHFHLRSQRGIAAQVHHHRRRECAMSLNFVQLEKARNRFRVFIDSTRRGEFDFALTPRAECTPYARCFAVFGYGLLCDEIKDSADGLARNMVRDLDVLKASRVKFGLNLSNDKPYLQLLTFTLSALTLLKRIDSYPLLNHIEPLLASGADCEWKKCGVFEGRPRSGNQAMFFAILLLYAAQHGIDTKRRIEEWERLHIGALNRFGFWGSYESMSHLQFQNGYHQYEIFEYLGTPGIPWLTAADNVAKLADVQGHFAPYPGGGGCYDYDAVFIITGDSLSVQKHSDLLNLTASTLIAEQNNDGGFCESKAIRPRSLPNLIKSLDHVLKGRDAARLERLRQAVTLLRRKHDRVHTHWSDYAREWGESDLWDSWFRMLTLARIDCAFNPEHSKSWGFINFPGIGFHPSLRGDC